MSGAIYRIVFYHAIFLICVACSANAHHCKESRSIVDGYYEVIVDCTDSNMSIIPKGSFPEDTTNLVLSNLGIKDVPDNAFVKLLNLRTLDLSNNDIETLRNTTFRGLAKLKVLKLNRNIVNIVESAVFSDLQSLETLLITNRNNVELLFEPIYPLKSLRVLSVSNPTILPTNNRLTPKLEVLDFYRGNVRHVTHALMNRFRSFNISSLAFRNQEITSIELGAFSNFPNLRSINLCCNANLGYNAAMAALKHTQNTAVDTLVLDQVSREWIDYNMFNMSDLCTPFGRKIRRLSIKSNGIVGIATKHALCVTRIQEFDLSYNPIIYIEFTSDIQINSILPIGYFTPNICSMYISMDTRYLSKYCNLLDSSHLYEVGSYFSSYPKCLTNLSVDDDLVSLHLSEDELKGLRSKFSPPSLQIIRFEYYRDIKMTSSNIFNADNHIRYINLSYTNLSPGISGSYFGLHHLETCDISHCRMSILKPVYVYYPSLKSLNVSHNFLDMEMRKFMYGCPKLEHIDMSHNHFSEVDSLTFSTCHNLKHIILDRNPIRGLHLELSNLTKLEILTIRSCKLHELRSAFTDELDKLYRVKRFTLDIRDNPFICSCQTLDFVRWMQTTSVDVTARDELTCLMDYKEMRIMDVSVTDLADQCNGYLRVIIVCVVVVVLGVAVVLFGLMWNWWYIKYRIIICSLSIPCKRRIERSNKYDSTVLYFSYPINKTDFIASRKIASWVLNTLCPIAEEEEGLVLFIADRNGLTENKTEQFVSAFENSRKLIVCVTPELLTDDSCMKNIRLALASNKPLSQFIIVNFCGEFQKIPLKQLHHLMQPNTPATYLVWNEGDHSDFWRLMRGALNRRSADNGCSGLLGRVTQESDAASAHELEPINDSTCAETAFDN